MNQERTRTRFGGMPVVSACVALAVALVLGLVPSIALAGERVTTAALPVASDGTAKGWSVDIGSGAMMSQTVIDGNFAYFCVGTSWSETQPKYANKIVQVRLSDGVVTKTADMPSIDYGCRPEIVNGVIYVPLPNGVMTAIRTSDLKTMWTSDSASGELQQQEEPSQQWSAQGHNAENSVYYDTSSKLLITATTTFDGSYQPNTGCVYAVHAETGEIAWSHYYDTAGFYWGGATVVNGHALIADASGFVHNYRVEDGEELTGLALGKAVNSDVVAYGSSAVVVDRTGVLHLLGFGVEEEVVEAGSVEAVDECKAAPTIANDNAYVCGNDGTNGAMAVVDLGSLSRTALVNRYTVPNGTNNYIPKSLDSSPIVSIHDGQTYVYFTSNYGVLSGTEYASGGTLFGLKLGDRSAYILYDPAAKKDANYCMNSPAFDSQGFVYYMNDSGFVTRLNKGIEMYRLYNPNSGEHFYTKSTAERDAVVAAGWTYEGIGWYAPALGASIYRMYNPNAGEHHYTLSATERDYLMSAGWNYEGVGWASSTRKAVPLYREYNPNQFACNHNYTPNYFEHTYLLRLGWRDEGIGWYGV